MPIYESKKSQDKIYFHDHCLDENFTQVSESLKRGNFQDLSFAYCLRFKEEIKSKTQDLIHWSEYITHCLSIRKLVGRNSLFDKNTD